MPVFVKKATAMAVAFLIVAAGADDAPSFNEQANEAYQAQEWDRALQLYRKIVDADAQDARARYRLAVSARHAGEADLARESLAAAATLGVPPAFIEVERAALYATEGSSDAALEALEAAVAAGFANPQGLRDDVAFSDLADSDAFNALLERAETNRAPCGADGPFRAFDFWLGEWEVHDARDNFAGKNVITSEEGGCFLLERWTGAGGSTGSSINFYDVVSGEWVQQWLSQGGSQIHIRGGLVDGAMVLTGKIYYITRAQEADFRGTWTPLEDGRVRQFFEQSVDGGETWSPWFEGFYSRVEAAAAGAD